MTTLSSRQGADAGTTASVQDYLAAVYDLGGDGRPVIGARLAKYMSLSPPAVTEAVHRLARDGFLRVGRGKVLALTSKGRDVATAMARRHRLLERWLTDTLGLDWVDAHDEAHRLEHALSPRVEQRLAETLGMPSTCPHGNPIPGMAAPAPVRPFPLSQAGAGDTVLVERITEEAEADRRLLEHLWRADIRPGRALVITEVAPWAGTVTATSDGRTITLGLAAASKIWVYVPGATALDAGDPRAEGVRPARGRQLGDVAGRATPSGGRRPSPRRSDGRSAPGRRRPGRVRGTAPRP